MEQREVLLKSTEEDIRQDRKKLSQSEAKTVRFKNVPSKEY